MPGDALSDLKHGPRQEAFRQRLRDREDLTLRVLRNPDHLGQEVERALRQLAERPLATGGARPAGAGPVGWDALAEASVGGKAAAALGLASLCSVARPTASGTYRTALTTTVVSASVACQD